MRKSRLHLKQRLAALKNLAAIHSLEVEYSGRSTYALLVMKIGNNQHTIRVGLEQSFDQWARDIELILRPKVFSYNQPFEPDDEVTGD